MKTDLQENIYLDILKEYHFGVFIYDIASRQFAYVNRTFAQIFGLPAHETQYPLGPVLRRVLTEDITYLQGRLNELMTSGRIDTTEFRLTVDGGQQLHLSCDAFLVRDNTAIAGFLKDVTSEKEHENYIVEITAQKDALLDMITHNLSGPLVLSQNILTWIQRSVTSNSTADLNQLLQLLQESTQQCMDIVNDFLNEEHKSSPAITVKKTRFDIAEKVAIIVDKLKEYSPGKTFRLDVNIANTNVTTDSVKFFQVVNNLISNAVKFTGENGIITISLTEEPEHFLLSVSDNGIGIPEDLKPYIFDKRSQAGRAGLQGEKSNGLGLSIVRRLVHLIGGEIWYESEEYKGATFFVRLPKE